jgi:Helix-hairpin-helix motif
MNPWLPRPARLGRRRKYAVIGLALLLGVTLPTRAQQYQRASNLDFDLLVQELFAQQGGDDATASYEDLYENLAQYFQSPLNLNTATPEELASLFILTPNQINSLQQHLRRHGALLTLYELQAVPGFDLPTIYKLAPFVTVPETGLQTDRRKFFARLTDGDNTALILRATRTLEERQGYTPPTLYQGKPTTRYLGAPEQLYARFRTTHFHDYSFGITAEKDAGEQLRWAPGERQYGPDFLSAHAVLYDRGIVKAIAVGDYQLQFGQGLLLSAGFAVGKGAETIATVRRPNSGIRPYTSVLETIYLRGAAATVRAARGLDVTVFGSRKRVDGSALASDTTDTGQLTDSFSALALTGFHRTATELARRQNVTETLGGGDLTYSTRSRALQVGVTGLATHYSAALQRTNNPYNRFAFGGTDNTGLSAHYSATVGSGTFFGEVARSKSGGVGQIHGLVASLSAAVDVAVVLRDYARDFHSFYGNAFGEGTYPINERGAYLGVKLRPISRWEISAYYDRFQFPWLRYRVDAPNAGGDEWLARVLFRPDKITTLYAQLRTERKDRNTVAVDGQYVSQLGVGTRRNAVVYAGFKPSAKLELRSRVQASSYQLEGGSKTTGYLIAQDLNVALARRLSLDMRFALFDTDDYDNRQYAYESDVLYAFSIPALSGRGSRAYTVLRYSINRHLDLWLRAARTLYRGQTTVGSGLEEIQGPRRTDLRVQLRWRVS